MGTALRTSSSAVTFFSLFFVLCIACKTQTDANKTDSDALKKPVVSVSKVVRTDLKETLIYPVDLQAEYTVTINALLSERIVKFPWQDGDWIEKGQIVAKIRADNASQALLQVRAELESIDAQIQNQKSELSRADRLLAEKVITSQTHEQLASTVQVSEAKRKSLEAVLSQSAISAGHAVIRSPISGIIANKHVNEGDLATPQFPLCDIMTIDPMKVVLKLTEKDAAAVQLHQPVIIELDAYPNRTFVGAISKILPYIDPATRTNKAEILLPNPPDPTTGGRLLKSGMFGRAKIIAKESLQTLAIPEKALLIDDKLKEHGLVAFVINNENTAERRSVRVGIREGDTVEVLDGLKEGELLVIRGQYGLEDGRLVTIFNRQSSQEKKKEPSK